MIHMLRLQLQKWKVSFKIPSILWICYDMIENIIWLKFTRNNIPLLVLYSSIPVCIWCLSPRRVVSKYSPEYYKSSPTIYMYIHRPSYVHFHTYLGNYIKLTSLRSLLFLFTSTHWTQVWYSVYQRHVFLLLVTWNLNH